MHQIENLSANQVLVLIDQGNLIGQAALRQRIAERGTHGTSAYDGDLSTVCKLSVIHHPFLAVSCVRGNQLRHARPVSTKIGGTVPAWSGIGCTYS
jgi:uncharacterized protein (DUF2237 family)